MPSTTQAKPPKKKLAPVESSATKPSKRNKKPRAESPEEEAPDSTLDETDAGASTENAPVSRAAARRRREEKRRSDMGDEHSRRAPAAPCVRRTREYGIRGRWKPTWSSA